MKESLKMIAITLLLCSYYQRYVFSVTAEDQNSCNIPYHKEKFGKTDVEEDALRTSEFSLVISDGVGGAKFTSKYTAEMLVAAASEAIVNSKDSTSPYIFGKNLASSLVEPLYSRFKEYQKSIETIIESLEEDEAYFSSNNDCKRVIKDLLSGSGTLVGCYFREYFDLLEKSSYSAKLRVFQAGDSLFMKFKEVKDTNGKIFYYPEFITNDMQKRFNSPTQISSYSIEDLKQMSKNGRQPKKSIEELFKLDLRNKIKEFEVGVKSTDLLLLGSDGLFDNLSAPVITLCIAEALKILDKKFDKDLEDLGDPKELLYDFIDQFEAYLEPHNETFKISMFNLQNERNTFESLMNYKIENKKRDDDIERQEEFDDPLINSTTLRDLGHFEDDSPDSKDKEKISISDYDLKSYKVLKQSKNSNELILQNVCNNLEKRQTLRLDNYTDFYEQLRSRKAFNDNLYDTEKYPQLKYSITGCYYAEYQRLEIPEDTIPAENSELDENSSNEKSTEDSDEINSPEKYKIGAETILESSSRERNKDFIIKPFKDYKKPLDQGKKRILITGKASNPIQSSGHSNERCLADDKSQAMLGETGKKGQPGQRAMSQRRNMYKTASKATLLSDANLPDLTQLKLQKFPSKGYESNGKDSNYLPPINSPTMNRNGSTKLGKTSPRLPSINPSPGTFKGNNYNSSKRIIGNNGVKTPIGKFQKTGDAIPSISKKVQSYLKNKEAANYLSRIKQGSEEKYATMPKAKNTGRTIETNTFKKSGCAITEFMDYPLDTKIEDVNVVPISNCILKMLKSRMIANDVIAKFGYSTIAKALAGAAKYMTTKTNISASPFAMKSMLFGRYKEGPKNDDISVVVSGITKKEISEKEIQDQRRKIKEEGGFDTVKLEADISQFLKHQKEKPSINKII